MRTGISLVSLVAAGLMLAASVSKTAEIEDLGWMAGQWRLTTGQTVVEEGWLDPDGGTMLGVNRTVIDDRTVAFEFLRLEELDIGVVLRASPGGRCPATDFPLIELSDRLAVFANPTHDFPQRITYRREGDLLHTEISGNENGEEKKMGWVFERVP